MALDPGLLQKVRTHGTQAVWHYCRSNALPSIIREGAIYSRAELIRRGIPFDPTHYYGTQRHEQVLGEYVSGAPLPPWGMMQYETEEIALLRLHPAVMAIPGTCFCPGWSSRAEFDPDEIVNWTTPEHLEELYTGSGPMVVIGGEFFVPSAIPVKAVRGVVFFNEASRAAAQPALEAAANESGVDHTINVAINPSRFPRNWQDSGPPWEGTDAPTI